ncbi:c-type cytochrome domain-containing protein [Thiorhodococcus minor]|uniref:Cytochrome C Planctomycete-type domain-containing protein n=1 Tax=Thiorhodococcus minor TaxID=57489 RepID=A0A6M0JVB9_9GAMM|nr:c-type cytochrome domain-containing protein [Thiorhodococcus minor]NEV61476.1 hypothetical protein [Thiorhodococcus minor]
MKKIMKYSAVLGLPVALMLVGCGKDPSVSYSADVKPILQQHCVECHLNGGAGFEASGFLVESYDSLMKGTKFGPVIVPGDSISSSLYRLVAGEVDPSIRMPHQKEPIPDQEIALIETWIAQGAQNN